jgi:hypothetical protein
MAIFTITAKADSSDLEADGNSYPFGGNKWFFGISSEFLKAQSSGASLFIVDMRSISFVTLFDWIGVLCQIDVLMSQPTTRDVLIDLKTDQIVNLPDPKKMQEMEEQIKSHKRQPSEIEFAIRKIYRIAGFIEAIGSSDILNTGRLTTRFSYRWLGIDGAKYKAYYGKRFSSETVVMGLMRIANGNEDHCRQFLDPERIATWRAAMGNKFPESPLFRYGEIWRVFCHELAANVYEHSGASGFIAARVLQTESLREQWCKETFDPITHDVLREARKGILELCISDAGAGFVATLENSYRRQARVPNGEAVNPVDILAFAFDELGTSKEPADCWATGRHALGRLLQIVGQYGGAITVRSGGAEIVYSTCGGAFKRRPRHLGYEPQISRQTEIVPGTHIQIILPLHPIRTSSLDVAPNSILLSHLPPSFRADENHVRGHLVPVKDRLGTVEASESRKDFRNFRRKCEVLARQLASRPGDEPMIFDLGELEWAPPQFETFLHLMQNAIQSRPVLLVELAPNLLRDIVQLESTEASTTLESEVVDDTPSSTGKVLANLSAARFLESIRNPILAMDWDGVVRIVNLPYRKYEAALLQLIDRPMTTGVIVKKSGGVRDEIEAILNNSNPLFEKYAGGKWGCSWSRRSLSVQGRRVMTKYFGAVAKGCGAWHHESRKVPSRGSKYNLPWQDEWRANFFQASRILVRQRHADEAAQRLIYRMEHGFKLMGRDLSHVKVLACMTAPSILLANAIHRWWPLENPPAIADLGPYIMLKPEGTLPTIVGDGSIVIVQDVLDQHKRTNRLHRLLKRQNKNVICILGLVSLVDAKSETGVTGIDDGWESNETPCHSLIRLLRPKAVDPTDETRDSFWVEPRTLRPFSYSLLRRDPSKRPSDGRPRPKFFPSEHKDIVASGHYVYGERHFSVVLDIKRCVDGPIGERLAKWIAEICIGEPERIPANWEQSRGLEFKGEVTMVLMPLHSQVHYLWNKVEKELADHGRRVLVSFLDATLFLGSGPAYRLPLQLVQQIDDTARAMVSNGDSNAQNNGIRLLILDDSTITGRTSETILAEVDRAVEKLCREHGFHEDKEPPVKWIRYFNIFNQMAFSKYIHWNNLTEIGRVWKIPFVSEEYWWISGLPVFDEDNCPACGSIKRLKQLVGRITGVVPTSSVEEWASRRQIEIAPSAVESPYYHSSDSITLDPPINLLFGSREKHDSANFVVDDSSLAVLRFYELLYLSYPPREVIPCAKNAWPKSTDEQHSVEFERFRWQVIQWCISNWQRLVADSAREEFLELVKCEIRHLSPLVVPTFEVMALHFNDDKIQEIIGESIDSLARLEGLGANFTDVNTEDARRRLRVVLFDALSVYYFSIPNADLWELRVTINGVSDAFLNVVKQHAERLRAKNDVSFLQLLNLAISKPKRFADPAWALRTVSETVFRGRVESSPATHGHMLLPKLLGDVMKLYDGPDLLALLRASLSLFVAALEDLVPFAYQLTSECSEIKKQADPVLKWLNERKDRVFADHEIPQACLRALSEDHFSPQSPFSQLLQEIFNPKLRQIEANLKMRKAEMDINEALDFYFVIPSELEDECALIDKTQFCHFLSNWTIDPIRKATVRKKSKIIVSKINANETGPELKFRLLTNFDSRKETGEKTMSSKHRTSELGMLKLFNVRVAPDWDEPDKAEIDEGFTSCYPIIVPIGYHYLSKKI